MSPTFRRETRKKGCGSRKSFAAWAAAGILAVAAVAPAAASHAGMESETATPPLVNLEISFEVPNADPQGCPSAPCIVAGAAGSDPVFSIRVENKGPFSAHGLIIAVKTVLAPEVSLSYGPSSDASIDPDPTDADTVHWSFWDLPTSQTIDLDVFLTASPWAEHLASVVTTVWVVEVSEGFAAESASLETQVIRQVDLSMCPESCRAEAPSHVGLGESFQVGFEAANNGPSGASNARLRVSLPPELIFVPSDAGRCSLSTALGVAIRRGLGRSPPRSAEPGQLVCDLGKLEPQQSERIDLTFQAPEICSDFATFAFEGSLTSDEEIDLNPGNEAASAESGLFCLDKTCPGAVSPGDSFQYRVRATNWGLPLSGLKLEDDLPPGLLLEETSCIAPGSGQFGLNGKSGSERASCSFDAMPTGSSGEMVLTVRLPEDYAGPDPVENRAGATLPDSLAPGQINSNACLTVPINPQPLACIMTGTPPVVRPDGSVAFQIEVTNPGNQSASEVRIEEPIPEGWAFKGGSPACRELPPQGGEQAKVECEVGDLGGRATETAALEFQLDRFHSCPAAVRSITTIEYEGKQSLDPDGVIGVCGLETEVMCGSAALVLESSSAEQAFTGGLVQVFIELSNDGTGPARDVAVTAATPQGLRLLDVRLGTLGQENGPGALAVLAASEGRCASTSTGLRCSVDSLDHGTRQPIVAEYRVDPGCQGLSEITHSACIEGTQLCSETEIRPVCAIDLDLKQGNRLISPQACGPASGLIEVAVTYTITLMNQSQEVFEGVVRDIFPDEVLPVSWSCSASGGSSCGASGVGDINDSVMVPAQGKITYDAAGRASSADIPLNKVQVENAEGDPVDERGSKSKAFDCNLTPAEGIAGCELASVIAQANQSPGPDLIILHGGSFSLDNQALSDDLNILGEGPGNSILTGNGRSRVLRIDRETADITLSCLTIREGFSELQAGSLDDMAGEGGGVHNQGSLRLDRVSVESNRALKGGGIFNQGDLTIAASTLAMNNADEGGAIFNDEAGHLELTNSTVSANTASGIHNFGSAQLIFSTVADNKIGIELEGGEATLSSTIVAINKEKDCNGRQILLRGNNLDGDGSCFQSDQGGDRPPLGLGKLVDNGGPTLTHALFAGSPAIDMGADTSGGFCQAQGQALSTDQRGTDRPLAGSLEGVPACDIGAYEAPPRQPDSVSITAPPISDFENPQLAYIMLGTPVNLQPSDALTVLAPQASNGSPLGAPSPSHWRLFRFDPDSRKDGLYYELMRGDEPPRADFFDFEPGKGSWLIVREGAQVRLPGDGIGLEGTINPTPSDAMPNETVAPGIDLTMQTGWQQITAPYNLHLDWSCISQAPANQGIASSFLCGFDPGESGLSDAVHRDVPAYRIRDSMKPGAGYWVFINSCPSGDPPCPSRRLVIPHSCACALLAGGQECAPDPSSPLVMLRAPSSAKGWRVKISVRAEGLLDTDNYLGQDPLSQDGLDWLDFRDPPPIHGLAAYFRHLEWDVAWPYLTSDIRASDDPPSAKLWEFEVQAQRPGIPVLVEWTMIGAQGRSLTLRDLEGNRTIDMMRHKNYQYISGPAGVRRFLVIAE